MGLLPRTWNDSAQLHEYEALNDPTASSSDRDPTFASNDSPVDVEKQGRARTPISRPTGSLHTLVFAIRRHGRTWSRPFIILLSTLLLVGAAVVFSTGRSPSSLVGEPWQLMTGVSAEVDWSKFAYTQYVTNRNYLCNSVMLFERLQATGSRADRIMLFPTSMHWSDEDNSTDARLLRKARDEYAVKLVPVNVLHKAGGDPTWADSYTKLLAFNETQYERVISLDSDATVMQEMDELFILPSSPMAAPRAYWLSKEEETLSAQLMVIQPSRQEFARISAAIENAQNGEFDMDIINNLYASSGIMLPHRRYNLLSGEFRGEDHSKYLGDSQEEWDPEAVLAEAKFVHFSDWPIPKPWIRADPTSLKQHEPKCKGSPEEGCKDRTIWHGLYEDFAKRRKEVCDLDV